LKTLALSDRVTIGSLSGRIERLVSHEGNYQYYIHLPPLGLCNELIAEMINLKPHLFKMLTEDHPAEYIDGMVLYRSLEGVSELYWKLKEAVEDGVKIEITKIQDNYERKELGIAQD
jgi:hypothetical protein